LTRRRRCTVSATAVIHLSYVGKYIDTEYVTILCKPPNYAAGTEKAVQRAVRLPLLHAPTDVNMGGLTGFLVVYFLGGFTFIPLLVAAVLLHAYLTLPLRKDTAYREDEADSIVQPGDDINAIKRAENAHREQLQPRSNHEADVAAGYFAISREYVRTIPVATPSASQSVYQSMYRSIFDRKPNASPLDNKGVGKPQRSGNVFYVVLRYPTILM
jgi:hypothetical protein